MKRLTSTIRVDHRVSNRVRKQLLQPRKRWSIAVGTPGLSGTCIANVKEMRTGRHLPANIIGRPDGESLRSYDFLEDAFSWFSCCLHADLNHMPRSDSRRSVFGTRRLEPGLDLTLKGDQDHRLLVPRTLGWLRFVVCARLPSPPRHELPGQVIRNHAHGLYVHDQNSKTKPRVSGGQKTTGL